jgi:thiol-disulfide isomerase/thioredoxin/glutaredoxin
MKPLLVLTAALALVVPGSADEPKPEAKKPDKPEVKIYDETADAKSLVATALTAAKRENRRVLIQWGGNWCSWCVLLHDKFKAHKVLSMTLRYEYDVVYVDSKNKELMEHYKADPKKGVPYLTVLDADGKVLANEETEQFETKIDGKNGHDAEKLQAFLVKYQAEPLKADAVLSAALAEAAKSDRKVFVHFGAPWCGWCHKLDAWLLRPDVGPVFAKDYVDCKLDQDRMTGAKDLYEKYHTGKPGGIPWFVVLDPAGKALGTSDDAKGQNVGFPADPQEIEHFVKLLNETKKRLTDKDVEALKTSLIPPPKASGEK